MPYQYDYNEIVGRPNPTTNALSAMTGVQNFFAKQEALKGVQQANQEREAVKNALSQQDMNNPDYGQLLSLAPEFTQKLMTGIAGLKQEDRLKAVQTANNINGFLGVALPHLAQNPNAYPALVGQMQKAGADPDYIKATVPNPADFAGNPQGYQQAIYGALNLKGLMTQNTAIIKGQLDQATAKTKGELANQGRTITAEGAKAVEGMKLDAVGLQQGKNQYVKIGEDQYGMASYDPREKKINITPLAPGQKPESVIKQEEITRRKSVGGGTKTGGSPKSLDEFLAGGQPTSAVTTFKPGTYKDSTGNLHYITTQDQFDELNK